MVRIRCSRLVLREMIEALLRRSTTSPAHRLVREDSRHTSHNNIQRGANVDRHRRRCVGASRNASADNTHDSIQANRNTVAGTTVGGREDFGRIGVECAIVDILTQVSDYIGTRRMDDVHTKQKLMAQVKPRFWALLLTSV